MKPNYNKVASFYDSLSGLIYGRTLINAQLYLLPVIPPGSYVLIVGGGTGWILDELTKYHPSGLTIDYVEASGAMIAQAARKSSGDNQVNFINGYIENTTFTGRQYDVVITPFLFDNFSEATMRNVFAIINRRLAAQGLWLYCDFKNTDSAKHKMLLRSMYFFFRLMCGVEASELPDTEDCFLAHYYHPIGQKTFMNGFVMSAIYKRV